MFIKDKSNDKYVHNNTVYNKLYYLVFTALCTVIIYELLSEMKTGTIYMTRNKLINNHITGNIVKYIK